MADRIPLVIDGSNIREIANSDRLDLGGNALQVGGNITPDTDSAYDIGSESLKFRDIYLSAGTIHLGGVKLRAEGNQLSVQDSTGTATSIAPASLQNNTTDDLTEGSSNLFYTTARADSAARSSLIAVDAGGDGSFSYDSATGKFTYTGPSAAETRAHINVVDAGGDGSFAYDSSLGKLTYTGPSAAEARAHFSGGTGVTYTSGTGEIAIGQEVGTTDNVTFAKTTMDSAVPGQISFNTSFADSHIAFEEGALWYDPLHKNLNYYTDFDHPIELGMQVVERVYNNTGSTILKGKPLYYFGNRTDEAGRESPTVALANATSATKYNVQGLAAEDIPNNSYGQIVVAGVIDGFDTSSLTAGENFFAGLTDGAVQNAAPEYPNFPMCLGWVIKSDANDGKVIINQQNHSVNTFRVQSNQHVGGNLVVDGDLTITGTQTVSSSNNVSLGASYQLLQEGDTIGEANTSFVGTGLDDAFYSGHYVGDSSNKGFFVKIDATGTPDTFEWGHDSTEGTVATGIAITGGAQELAFGIAIDFGATTGHTTGDKWTGSASPVATDTGFITNRNTGTTAPGFTHMGLFYDVTDDKWKLFDEFYPRPSGAIDTTDSSFSLATLVATTFEGALTGNVTGDVTGDVSGNAGTATALATARNIGGVSFDGTANINLPGVNTTGNQNTTGSAATLTTARNIGGVAFDGSANIDLPGVNTTGNQNTTGSAATLTTARNIGGVAFDGSANINLPGVNTAGNQNTSGNAATSTRLDSSGRTFALTGDVTGSVTSDLGGGFSISTSIAANTITSNELSSASTLTIKNTSGTTLKTVIGAGS